MKRPQTAAKSPLDIVLLHFPEVRQGTIIGRCGVSGQSGSIIWYIRMPDASYCKVQIGLNQKPSKTPLDPDLADHLEAVWQGMGDAALMALKQLSQIVHRQAVVMGYGDAFFMLTLFYFGLSIMVTLLKKPRKL